MAKKNKFRKELETLINRNNKESGSDTPDYLLAEFLVTSVNGITFDPNLTTESR